MKFGLKRNNIRYENCLFLYLFVDKEGKGGKKKWGEYVFVYIYLDFLYYIKVYK